MFHPKEPLRGKMLVALDRQLTEERDAIYEKLERRRAAAMQRRLHFRAAFLSVVRVVMLSNVGIGRG